MSEPQARLRTHTDWVIGIDSDGCVFDTMEIKQKQCFHPVIVRHWQLEPIEAQVRETAEFVNLYSRWRGQNRFVALLKTFEWLVARKDLPADHPPLPALDAMRAYVESGLPLSNATLTKEVERTGNTDLRSLLEWSLAVDEEVRRVVEAIPPFAAARVAIEKLAVTTNIVVVSQTPTEALEREWAACGLQSCIKKIAGQEQGTKTEILQALQSTYGPETRILMIGDAPGDWQAAQTAHTRFYPIMPGDEERSWERFLAEAHPRFVDNTYDAAYQQQWVHAFEQSLPAEPPAHWFTARDGV